MKKRLILSSMIAVTAFCFLPAAAAAQEITTNISIFRQDDVLTRNIGTGWWWNNDTGSETTGGLAVNLYSRHFLLDVDLARGRGVQDFHISPYLVPQASLKTGSGFRSSLRLYPTLGVADIQSKDSRFDYGVSLAFSAGWRIGLSVLGRYTKETKAITVNIAF